MDYGRNMPESISFGTWLRQRRRTLDLTQKTFAQRVGCAEITVRRMEADEYKPSNELALMLFEKLGISESERPQWVRFARGLAEHPNQRTTSQIREQKTNLPTSLTSFIGREKEKAEIIKLVKKNRLVSLVGAGGIGKSRLSLQAGFAVLNDFPNGIWLVELAPLSDPALVPQVIATTLGLIEQSSRSPLNILRDFLQSKRTLLIIDNCEHLIQACAQLAETLLHACPDLQILATSREALGVAGENLYLVPTLTTPDPINATLDTLSQYEAVQLFLERAQSAVADFSLTQDNASAVAQVCYHLDGIPLAVELAAARVKLLRVEEIAAHLHDRFRLLTSGARTALPRHQTLQALIDWSYELLSEPERRLLCDLSVFAGGWTLEAAEAVCAREEIEQYEILDLLTQLVNKSLVIAERKQGRETRYGLLETIRQYMQRKLHESGGGVQIRSWHARYYMYLAEEAEPKLSSNEQVRWLARLDQELDNLRAAIGYALSNDEMMVALRLEGALWYFLYIRGYHDEGRLYMKETLSRSDAMKPVASRAKVLNGAGFIAWVQSDYDEARSLLERGLIIGRELDDKSSIAVSLRYLGAVALSTGEFAFARSCLKEVLSMPLQLIGSDGLGWSLNFLGDLEIHRGDYDEAKVLFERSVVLLRQLDAKDLLAYPLRRLGQLALRRNDPVTAKALCRESLELNLRVGDRRAVAACLAGMATISLEERKYERAATLLGVVDAQLDKLTAPLFYTDRVVYEHTLQLLHEALDEKIYSAAYAIGRAMPLEQAIALAADENSR
jgi:predicted ATPase/DNA-binding XRE family transcriptional regulator